MVKEKAGPLGRAHPALSFTGLPREAATEDLDLHSMPSMQRTQLEGGGVPVAPTGDCARGPAPLMAAHGRQGVRPDTVGLFFLLH